MDDLVLQMKVSCMYCADALENSTVLSHWLIGYEYRQSGQFSIPYPSSTSCSKCELFVVVVVVVVFVFQAYPCLSPQAAEALLQKLGALNSSKDFSSSVPLPLSVTPLGRTMAQFPVAPRYAKMLALGGQQGCLPYVIALVSALSVKEVFEEGGAKEGEDERKKDGLRRSWAGKVPFVGAFEKYVFP